MSPVCPPCSYGETYSPTPSIKFLLDQSTDACLLSYITQLSHDAIQIRRTYPQSIPDPEVLFIAQQEQHILSTDDRDFGELVFRSKLAHTGVIFLRLGTYVPLSLTKEIYILLLGTVT